MNEGVKHAHREVLESMSWAGGAAYQLQGEIEYRLASLELDAVILDGEAATALDRAVIRLCGLGIDLVGACDAAQIDLDDIADRLIPRDPNADTALMSPEVKQLWRAARRADARIAAREAATKGAIQSRVDALERSKQ
jgi:hypothetical protein